MVKHPVVTATGRQNVEIDDPVDRFVAALKREDAGLRRYAFRLVGADVDDVLQDAYLKAYRAHDRFRGDAAYGTWLFRIVHNCAMNHLRRQRSSRTIDSTSDWADQRVSVARGAAGQVDLEAALGAIAVEQRAAILLICLEGLTYEEASAVLDVPVGTLGSRVNRGRQALQEILTTGENA